MSNSEAVINHIKKRKRDLVEVMGGKCCICGFNSFIEALEFHHIDPKTKEFGIGATGSMTKALTAQLEEVKKCALLCSNCHKGVHCGYLQLPDKIYYNQQLADNLLKENEEIKYGKKHYCQRCGKLITQKATYCPECKKLLSRKVDRPSREELKDLIRSIPFTQIGKQYSVSDNAIKKWCAYYGLPKTKKEINGYSEDEWKQI